MPCLHKVVFRCTFIITFRLCVCVCLNEKLDEIMFLGKGDNGSNATVHGSKYRTANTCSKRVVRKKFKLSLSPTFPKDPNLVSKIHNLVDIKKTHRTFKMTNSFLKIFKVIIFHSLDWQRSAKLDNR